MAKDKQKESRAYMAFTGAMILCCLGLYVAQSIKATSRLAEPTPTPTPLHAGYPAQDAFLENAAAFGLAARAEALDGTLPGAAEYRLVREGMEDGRLTLSFQEGGVCAFLLRLPLAQAPEEPPKNATPIEKDLYEARRTAFGAEQTWRQEALAALCAALDPTGTCTAADITRFCALLEESGRKSTAQADTAGDLSFESYLLYQAGETFLCASASRRDS